MNKYHLCTLDKLFFYAVLQMVCNMHENVTNNIPIHYSLSALTLGQACVAEYLKIHLSPHYKPIFSIAFLCCIMDQKHVMSSIDVALWLIQPELNTK